VKLWTNRVLSPLVKGSVPAQAPALVPEFTLSARQRREGPKPLSLDYQATGSLSQSGAWRTWIGPPEGAFDGCHGRPPTSPVRDLCIRLRRPIAIVSELDLPRPARQRVMAIKHHGASRPRMRHTLEDGVANAEAPSSQEGSLRCLFEFERRVLTSARNGTEGNPALAPKTDASSVYGIMGH